MESALSLLGYAEHVTAWKIAIMLHRVTGETGGILEWAVAKIAKEPSINCHYETARTAIAKLIDAGVFEVSHEVKEKCCGGKPYKALRIDWTAVARIINPPKPSKKQRWPEPSTELLKPSMEPQTKPIAEPRTESQISKPLISLQSTFPPPPTGRKLAAVEALKNHLCDFKLCERLATEHPADVIESVVADFELNRNLFRGPGAIRYRLDSGEWPTDETVCSAVEHQRRQEADENRRRQEAQRRQAEMNRREQTKRLRQRFGPQLDAMSEQEHLKFGLEVLAEEFHNSFKSYPGMFRTELLEALDTEGTR